MDLSGLSQRWQRLRGPHESTCGILESATRFGQPENILTQCTRQPRNATVVLTSITACPLYLFAQSAAFHPLSRGPKRSTPLRVRTCAARVLLTEARSHADRFRHACTFQSERTRPRGAGCQGQFRDPFQLYCMLMCPGTPRMKFEARLFRNR